MYIGYYFVIKMQAISWSIGLFAANLGPYGIVYDVDIDNFWGPQKKLILVHTPPYTFPTYVP